MAELEQKWQSEAEDAVQGKLENNMPFFSDYHFNEVSTACESWGMPPREHQCHMCSRRHVCRESSVTS